MKKRQNKLKGIAIALAIFLLPVGAFTLGYFYKNDILEGKNAAQTLTVNGDIGGTITNEVGDTSKILPGDKIIKTVEIKPNCTSPSLVRVKVEAYWDKMSRENGTKVNDNLSIDFNENNIPVESLKQGNEKGYWYEHSDGYLYYIGLVSKESSNFNLVDSITFSGDKDINSYQGKTIKMDVNLDVVQSRDGAFESAWNMTGEDNTELRTKLLSLCQNN